MASSTSVLRKYQIGWIGLGNMGSLMAINLANAIQAEGGPSLQVWNRTLSKCEELKKGLEKQESITIAKEIEEIGKNCNVIFSSLANDGVVKEVYEKLFSSIKKETLLIETSTIYPDVTESLAKRANSIGCQWVQALPFGQPPVAKNAQLVFAIAGETKSVEMATEIIVPTIGKKTLEFGQDPSKASTFKLIGNSIILSTVEMLAESMTLAEKCGIGSERVLEWMETLYPAPPAINYANKIANLKFLASGGFDLRGGLKDATLIARLGKESNCQMHIVEQAIKHINKAIELNEGQENKDWAALSGSQRVESGLKPFEK